MDRITLELNSNTVTKLTYPYDFDFLITYLLKKNSITVTYTNLIFARVTYNGKNCDVLAFPVLAALPKPFLAYMLTKIPQIAKENGCENGYRIVINQGADAGSSRVILSTLMSARANSEYLATPCDFGV